MITLDKIDSVLLDMDGTLLNKCFDDYFWERLVPERYAERHNMTFGKAKEELLARYRRHERTLSWTDIDFWSGELGMDIKALKEQIRHLIEVHPNVECFLRMLKGRGKNVFLVTNAHHKTIDLKLKETGIGRYFDSVVSSFDLGYPKEFMEFWRGIHGLLGFDSERTLLIDDTEEVLRTASGYGIRYVLLKAGANSRRKDHVPEGFPCITDFSELM